MRTHLLKEIKINLILFDPFLPPTLPLLNASLPPYTSLSLRVRIHNQGGSILCLYIAVLNSMLSRLFELSRIVKKASFRKLFFKFHREFKSSEVSSF